MTLPSLPPDVNIASWIGCHRTWKMLEFKVKLSGVYTLKKLLYPPQKKRTAYRAGLLLVTSKCLHLLLQIAQVKQLRREDQLFFQKPTQMCSLLKQSSISSSFSIRIHHLEQMISAGSDEPVAILIPSTVHDCWLVRMDCRENLGKIVRCSCLWCQYWCHNVRCLLRPVLTLDPRVWWVAGYLCSQTPRCPCAGANQHTLSRKLSVCQLDQSISHLTSAPCPRNTFSS